MTRNPSPLCPLKAGIGLRSPHIADVLAECPTVGWFEVHAENCMHDGPLADALERLRACSAISMHGVGLSLGSAGSLNAGHLERFRQAVDRFEPAFVSEHVSWSVGEGIYLNDLLPLPYDEAALSIVADHIDQVQEALKRTILVENLSQYVRMSASTMEEPEFLNVLARRTGCGLLLDVNNIYVSAVNVGFDAKRYIGMINADAVSEIHLAGHTRNRTPDGDVLIDDHGSQVAEPVWNLFRNAIEVTGVKPVLIEWDSALPSLDVLVSEADTADRIMAACMPPRQENAAAQPSPPQHIREIAL